MISLKITVQAKGILDEIDKQTTTKKNNEVSKVSAWTD